MCDISRLLKESIQYSLDHRDAALTYALQYARDMDKSLADQFVGMYVNDWTLDYGPRPRSGTQASDGGASGWDHPVGGGGGVCGIVWLFELARLRALTLRIHIPVRESS